MKTRHILLAASLMVAVSACGTQRQLSTSGSATVATKAAHTAKAKDGEGLRFMQRVADNALYQKNVVSNLTFSLSQNGGKIQVPGILRMRKDDVIRLQLLIPVLRTEVGRVEFTPDGVLFVDRLHHQYVKAGYDEVDFLKDNGITFYSLQSLFWNQLLLPGEQRVGEAQLNAFSPELGKGDSVPVRLHEGKLDYDWTVTQNSARILSALITYTSREHGVSTLRWDYADFRAFGSKQYPYRHEVTVETEATGEKKSLSATFSLSDVKAEDGWEGRTTLSGKYKQVALEDVLGKLMNLAQ